MRPCLSALALTFVVWASGAAAASQTFLCKATGPTRSRHFTVKEALLLMRVNFWVPVESAFVLAPSQQQATVADRMTKRFRKSPVAAEANRLRNGIIRIAWNLKKVPITATISEGGVHGPEFETNVTFRYVAEIDPETMTYRLIARGGAIGNERIFGSCDVAQ